MRKGVFIVRLDMDTGEVLRVENRACAAEPARLGSPPAEGEVCGVRGRFRVGGLWLCTSHYRTALQDAEALGRAGRGIAAPIGACTFPVPSTGRSAILCGEPAVAEAGGAPACDRHYGRALAWHRALAADEKNAADEAAAGFRAEAERRYEAEMRSWSADGTQIVYYLRRPDGAVKIGTSKEFDRRLANLSREYGELEILLTHCGDHPRENEMHHKFADLLIGREWFRAEEPLLSWIEWVRRRRLNMRTAIPGTVPIRYIRALLREAKAAVAADPAA